MTKMKLVTIKVHKKCKTPLTIALFESEHSLTARVLDYCILCNEPVIHTNDKSWMIPEMKKED